jgi:hypothetical protein
VSGLASEEQQVFDVSLSEDFCALANHSMRSLKLECIVKQPTITATETLQLVAET